MKRCDYCGGDAGLDCVSAPDGIGIMHYSKIECAGRLKIELERAMVDRDCCCAGTEELRKKLEIANLQNRELEKAAEGGLRITCDNAYHDRGHGVCSFCVQKRIDAAVDKERERCAQLVNDWAKAYPASMFGNPEDGKHGPTVDSCSAKALRLTLPVIAEEIRGHELDSTEKPVGEKMFRCGGCGDILKQEQVMSHGMGFAHERRDGIREEPFPCGPCVFIEKPKEGP